MFFLTWYSFCQAQELEVSNVSFEDKSEIIVVQYDLYGEIGKKYRVNLSLSDNNGISFAIRPKTVSGDIGKDISPGPKKTITWSYIEDFPNGLSGDKFVFAVDAELQKGGNKFPYYIIGAGVAGGVVYFVTSSFGKKEPEPKTGSIIIDVPNDF